MPHTVRCGLFRAEGRSPEGHIVPSVKAEWIMVKTFSTAGHVARWGAACYSIRMYQVVREKL